MVAEIEDRTDRRDILELALLHLPLTQCPGGRFIIEGYVCGRCGKDPTYGKCGAPKRKRKRKERGNG